MALKKYTTPEKLEVFSGEEAGVVNKHLAKTGKAVSDFSDEEREAFLSDLEAVRPSKSDDVETDDAKWYNESLAPPTVLW